MKKTFDAIDTLIKSGQGMEARRRLKKVAETKLERVEKLRAANLARRANLHSLAIHILNPLIRPKGKLEVRATDEEKAEYAASLSYVGASEEAITLLQGVDSNVVPEVSLYEAFVLFSRWDYRNGIPILKKFISSKISPYQVLVGKVNLAAALVYEKQSQEAASLLDELVATTKREDLTLLLGNCLELQTQNFLHQKNYREARAVLKLAEAALSQASGHDQIFINKWKAIIDFQQTPHRETTIAALHRVQSEGRKHSHWETIRDCDRVEAIALKNKRLFYHLYFGTPYPAFRERLIADFGNEISLPPFYDWLPFNGKSKGSTILDIQTGKDSASAKCLKVGQAPHRLLHALVSDTYRPLRIAVAYASIFPGEFFNPITTPPRVYEVVRRLREWMTDAKIPLEVRHASRSFYRLQATAPLTIRLAEKKDSPKRDEIFLNQISAKWSDSPFSTSEVAKHLNLSPRSASRLISELEQNEIITRWGRGPKTVFKLKAA